MAGRYTEPETHFAPAIYLSEYGKGKAIYTSFPLGEIYLYYRIADYSIYISFMSCCQYN